MTIETQCSQCQRPLRLKPELAGKRIKCPQCKAVVQVPEPAAAPKPAAASTAAPVAAPVATRATPTPTAPAVPAVTPPAPVATPAAAANPGKAAPVAKPAIPLWHLKTEEGDIYGPVPRNELDQWAIQGRISADCQLLLDGSDQWQWATDLYPDLEEEFEEEEPDTPPPAPVPAAPAAAAAKSTPPPEPAKPVETPKAATATKPTASKPTEPAKSTEPTKPVEPAKPVEIPMPPAPATAASTTTRSSWRDEPARPTASRPAPPPPVHASDDDEESVDEEDADDAVSDRRWITAFLLAFFLGTLGIHRFYLGRVGTGVAMLFTGGGCLIWQIIDVVSIAMERLPDHLGRPLKK